MGEKATVMTMTIPKLQMISKLEKWRAAKPKSVVVPESDIAVPIRETP
jgi:hypothetical protein